MIVRKVCISPGNEENVNFPSSKNKENALFCEFTAMYNFCPTILVINDCFSILCLLVFYIYPLSHLMIIWGAWLLALIINWTGQRTVLDLFTKIQQCVRQHKRNTKQIYNFTTTRFSSLVFLQVSEDFSFCESLEAGSSLSVFFEMHLSIIRNRMYPSLENIKM